MTNPDYEMGEKLYRKLGDYWAGDKHVSRAGILQTVHEIDQMFKVASGTDTKITIEHLHILMKWFYFGFKRRY